MPFDLSHWWGNDLSLSPSGDLAVTTGLNRDNQHIFRRLCTNGSQSGAQKAEYIFLPSYGGSAPWYVGQAVNEGVLAAIIRTQMYMEASVSQTPEPNISVSINPNGAFTATINYVDAATGQQVPTLTIDVTN